MGPKLNVEEPGVRATDVNGTRQAMDPRPLLAGSCGAFGSLLRRLPDVGRLVSLVVCGLLLAAYGLLAHNLFAAVGLYQVQEIVPDVFAWIPDDVIDLESDPQFCRAATAGFIVTSDGVVVVDTANSPFHARELLFEIRKRTEAPIKYVINTSAAPDHMLGNEVFTDQESTLISTAAAKAGMEQYRRELRARLQADDGWRLQPRMRGIHVTPATQTFQGDITLRMGDREFKIVSLIRESDAAEEAGVYIPSAKTLFLGQLYENHYFPRIGTRDVHRWIEILRRVEGWDVSTYVPGHGPPGSKKDLTDFRKFLEWLVVQVEMRLTQGKSTADVQKELLLPKIYDWHAPELAADAVADVCRQLGAPPAPPTPVQPGQP
jgi:glyoxylase-like metal-dependent hydrolase (beta-lactamase superfamily II)